MRISFQKSRAYVLAFTWSFTFARSLSLQPHMATSLMRLSYYYHHSDCIVIIAIVIHHYIIVIIVINMMSVVAVGIICRLLLEQSVLAPVARSRPARRQSATRLQMGLERRPSAPKQAALLTVGEDRGSQTSRGACEISQRPPGSSQRRVARTASPPPAQNARMERTGLVF